MTGPGDAAAPPDDAPAHAVAVLEIGDCLDLHGFQPRDIPDVVASYLEAAAERGLGEVRIVHGRGRGTQRARVRQVLAGHPLVTGFDDATPLRGGWGAQVVWLRTS